MSIRVVCFDLGGVLVRICRSWQDACAAARVPYRTPSPAQEAHWNAKQLELQREHQTGRIGSRSFFEQIATACDGLYSTDEVARIHRAWVLDEYPGVTELIAELQAIDGLSTACLSNTDDTHWRGILHDRHPKRPSESRYPGILNLERHLVSHELGSAKPELDIYRKAEAALDTLPQQIVFFDDLLENVHGARSAGWHAEHIDHAGDPSSQMRAHLEALGVIPTLQR